MAQTQSPLSPTAQHRWSVVDGLLSDLRVDSVLEIGCGMGGFGARLASRYRYVGVERDPLSYAAARARIEPAGGRVVHGSVEDLDETGFDLVCAFEVLEHIEDDRGALAGWAAKVAAGGHLMLSVPADPARFGAADEAVGHYRRYSRQGIEEVLRSAGLRPVTVVNYGWPLGFATETVRNLLARRSSLGQQPIEARTGASGRWLQPGPRVGRALNVAVRPFEYLQTLRPGTGPGLVAVAEAAR